VNAFMSMGLVKVMGKNYTPLRATHRGGDAGYRLMPDGNIMPATMQHGEFKLDPNGNPLYLMRREVKAADNRCTLRRGKDTSYPFKWQYVNKEVFSSRGSRRHNLVQRHGRSRCCKWSHYLQSCRWGKPRRFLTGKDCGKWQ